MNRSTARGIYLFVNGRWVKDRVIQHALFAGYSGRLMKGQYPVAVLFLKVPFDQVDVNVHPTKHEIRFVRQKMVHDTVRETPWLTPSGNPIRPGGKHLNGKWPSHFDSRQTCPSRMPTTECRKNASTLHCTQPATLPDSRLNRPLRRSEGDTPDSLPSADPVQPAGARFPTGPGRPPTARQAPLWKKRFFADLTLIGQYKGTYIICESDNGLMLIDQHAAHERIVFEQLKSQSIRAPTRRPASAAA
jgi:DNA mismatch repair protein MutL